MKRPNGNGSITKVKGARRKPYKVTITIGWKNDSGKSVMSDIMGPNGSFVIYNTKESTDTYELGNQKESSSKGRDFKEERDLVYPIPTTEISQSNGSIVQNPGYN